MHPNGNARAAETPSEPAGVVARVGRLEDSLAAAVAIATYNEADNIVPLVEELVQIRPPLGVVVVDDASPDGTGELADRLAAAHPGRVVAVHRAGKLGYASAVRTALKHCYEAGFQRIVVMDCDHSHHPAAVPRLLERLDDADMVIGSRYVPGGTVLGWPWYRWVLSRSAGVVVRVLTGMPLRDPTSGFRAFRRELLERIAIWRTRAEGYGFLTEVAFRAWLAGARIAEVPIVFTDRTRGRSKLSRRIIFEAAALVAVLGWVSRWPGARRRYLEEMTR